MTAVNRQYMTRDFDRYWREVGVRVFDNESSLDTEPEDGYEVEGREASDIDTIHELRAAQTTRKTIEFAVTGNEKVGSGHVKRCLDLANELQHHDIVFSVHDSDDWVYDWIQKAEWPIQTDPKAVWNPADLVIIDQLDTTTEQVAGYKANGSKVVTIEDQGTGVWDADLTINALYRDEWQRGAWMNDVWSNEVSGPKWADLRPEFVGLPSFKVWDTKRVLVMFGGTDPSGLGERVEKWVPPYGDITLVKPHADVSVAWEMMNHDLLITSAGRTVYEAAAVGIPTIVIAQNARETSHAHLGVGNLYLGVGSVVTDEQIVQTVVRLLQDHDLRQELSDISRASVDGKGLQRISWAVEGLLRGM
jgi:spore coat polysaccharide biosynthesis predicted glycosyltransferase SpsG